MNQALISYDALSPGRDFDNYVATVSRFPILTPDEERSLATRLFEQDDVEAARQLVLSHLRFVVHIARSYSGYGLALADLVQEGNVGLMKAVKRFDPGYGVRLVSFAVHWIKAEMHEFILRNWRIVKIATTKAQRKLFFNLRSSKKRLGWMNQDEVEAVARDLGVSAADVLKMEGRMALADAAFDGDARDDDDVATAPVQYLHDDDADPADLVANAEWDAHMGAELEQALATLDDRSRDILSRRWLAEDKATLQSLADEYGVSAERIRQLESAALKKLRTLVA